MDIFQGGGVGSGSSGSEMDRKFTWLKPYIERLVIMMKSSDTQQWLQVFVVDPVLSYIMNRFFAYFIIAFILFGALLIFVILTFIVLVLRTKHGHALSTTICPTCSLG